MANRLERTPLRGESGFRIGDCYVWSEIQYLDSPTNYKEFLSENVGKPDSSLVCWPGVFGLAIVLLAGILRTSCLVYLAVSGY